MSVDQVKSPFLISSSFSLPEKRIAICALTALVTAAVSGVLIYATIHSNFWPSLNAHISHENVWFLRCGPLALSFTLGVIACVLRNRKANSTPQEEVSSFPQGIKLNGQIDEIKNYTSAQVVQEYSDVKSITLKYAWQHHAFMDALTKVSDDLKISDTSTKAQWREFLESKRDIQIIYPDGTTTLMNPQLALERLEGTIPEIHYEEKTTLTDKEIQDICLVEKASFETPIFMKQNYDQEVHKKIIQGHLNGNYSFILAKDSNERVVGLLEYYSSKDTESVTVSCICRLPTHGLLNIGKKLMTLFKEKMQNSCHSAYLRVRESNPAIELYKKMEFRVTGKLPNYYPCPKEDALSMQCTFPQKS